ncbi:methionine--tRNA ligase [bacterium]|nr:methionine--tRNA ligase [bacterium]
MDKKDKVFYITTPLYYVNSHPHLGHSYSTIVADIINRYKKLFGFKTYFLTGTDEHGQKIVEAANRDGKSPKEFVDEISEEFKKTWRKLGIEYSQFIRTTDGSHKRIVQSILQKVYNKGEIYFAEYEGLYCVGCERFLDKRELVDSNCPEHKAKPTLIKEGNYFFKMSKYQDWLIDYINKNEEFISPEQYKTEILSFLKEPLNDLCISRPKDRLDWGIELPFDKKYVTYVWFDALINYISALGYPDGNLFKEYWKYSHHIIGKDILKAHAVYWPTMLSAIGLEPMQKLIVHGYWNNKSMKMSKSIGNVVDPLELVNVFGVDGLRFLLMSEMVFGKDADFRLDSFITSYNAHLANNFGNLVSRVINFTVKNFDGRVPECMELTDLENVLQEKVGKKIDSIKKALDNFLIHEITKNFLEISALTNQYFDKTEPWKLVKNEGQRDRLGSILYTCCDIIRIMNILISPVMPNISLRLANYLGYDSVKTDELDLNLLQPGQLMRKPESLFPRIEQ